MKQCIATFQPQAWINDEAVNIDGAVQFDIAKVIEEMGREAALLLQDNSFDSDKLAEQAGVAKHHNGPFYVACQDAIADYFGGSDDRKK